jgi:hypothetical protein
MMVSGAIALGAEGCVRCAGVLLLRVSGRMTVEGWCNVRLLLCGVPAEMEAEPTDEGSTEPYEGDGYWDDGEWCDCARGRGVRVARRAGALCDSCCVACLQKSRLCLQMRHPQSRTRAMAALLTVSGRVELGAAGFVWRAGVLLLWVRGRRAVHGWCNVRHSLCAVLADIEAEPRDQGSAQLYEGDGCSTDGEWQRCARGEGCVWHHSADSSMSCTRKVARRITKTLAQAACCAALLTTCAVPLAPAPSSGATRASATST